MNRFIALTALLLSSLAASAAAQTSADPGPADSADVPAVASQGPAKIAVIAFQAAVTQTNEFQRNFGDLQKKFEPKRQELKTLSDQIDTLKKQLQTQADTLNDAERESRARTIDEKEKQLQRTQEDDQNDFQQEMQDTFNGVASKVGDVVIAYAQQRGFTLVLDGGNQEAQTVLYASPATDITKAIIDAYNVKSGVPAPPAQPAAAAPKPAPRTPAQHPAAAPTQH
jgi:outer membrane protein